MSLADTAIAFFTGKGWTKEQAAGIVGNLDYESAGLNVKAVGDYGQAYGLAQWHPDRQMTFQRIIGKSIKQSTFEEQLSFVDWELKNTEAYAGSQIKKASTVHAATDAFMRFFERPASNSSLTERVDRANKALVTTPGQVVDENVNQGFDYTFGVSKAITDWIDGKLSTIGSNMLGAVIGLVGLLVILFGVYKLVIAPGDAAKGAALNLTKKALA